MIREGGIDSIARTPSGVASRDSPDNTRPLASAASMRAIATLGTEIVVSDAGIGVYGPPNVTRASVGTLSSTVRL